MGIRKIIFAILILVSFEGFAEPKIELFGESEDDFYKGTLVDKAIHNGVTVVFYKLGLRQVLEAKLSEGLGKDPEKASALLKEKMALHPEIIDGILQSAQGEQRIIEYKINRFPAILIDGKVFYSVNVERVLENLK